MKLIPTIFCFLIFSYSQAQDHQKSYWFNAALSTTDRASHYGGSIEANLALDQYIFSLGFDYYNLPSTTEIGNAHNREIYLAPGYQFFLNPRFTLGFRFGPALSFYEAPLDSDQGERTRFMRLYLPLKLRAAYDFGNNWGLYSELAYLPEGNTLRRQYFVGKLGLRFGRLMPYSAQAARQIDSLGHYLSVGMNAGVSPVGFTQGSELAWGRNFWFAKVGLYGNYINREDESLNIFTLAGGLRYRWLKLSLSAAAGYGRFSSSRQRWVGGASVQESRVESAFIFQPGLAYHFTEVFITQLQLLMASEAASYELFMYGSLGLAYQFYW